jgi:hypothetical protein
MRRTATRVGQCWPIAVCAPRATRYLEKPFHGGTLGGYDAGVVLAVSWTCHSLATERISTREWTSWRMLFSRSVMNESPYTRMLSLSGRMEEVTNPRVWYASSGDVVAACRSRIYLPPDLPRGRTVTPDRPRSGSRGGCGPRCRTARSPRHPPTCPDRHRRGGPRFGGRQRMLLVVVGDVPLEVDAEDAPGVGIFVGKRGDEVREHGRDDVLATQCERRHDPMCLARLNHQKRVSHKTKRRRWPAVSGRSCI